MNTELIHQHLASLTGWQLNKAQSVIYKDYRFRDFHQTMSFVNAVADIAHQTDHHPDMEIAYDHCLVKYTTHSEGGLSEKDFKCAKQVDKIPNNI